MGKIETTLKSEIVRLTRRELRATVSPLAADVRRMKRTVSQLVRTTARLERAASAWDKQMSEQQAALKAPEEQVKAARFSPALIKKLRTRLGVTQAELAALLKVSGVAVWSWEAGRTRPTGENRTALVALRNLGRREVRKLLEKNPPAEPKAAKPQKRRRKSKKSASRKKQK